MKIKITTTLKERGLLAGEIYDLPEDEAQELIGNEQAIQVLDDEPQPVKAKRK